MLVLYLHYYLIKYVNKVKLMLLFHCEHFLLHFLRV